MGVLVGMVAGIGLLLLVDGLSGRRSVGRRTRPALAVRLADLMAQAGLDGALPGRLLGSCAVGGLVTFAVMSAVSRVVVVGLAFALFGAYAPIALLRYRARRRRTELRGVWPDVVDDLASAVRAGLALPEAVSQLAQRGPEVLRSHFAGFAQDYRATGRFSDCLDRLKAGLADPVGDRVVEALRLAREVGGSDLGRLLRTLSAFLREDFRTRAELEARQTWTVNGARLAAVAPWVLLGMLSLRPQAVHTYASAAGASVLVVGGVVTVVAYRLMLRLGRLPEEERVLR